MNIEFSKEQFRDLLDLVYTGNWLINANRDEPVIKKYEDLQSYIFSKCGEFGYKEYTEKYCDEFCPSANFDESGIMDLVDEYNDNALFEELAEELSYRDAPIGLSKDELGDFVDKNYDRYIEEFTENSLDNVYVKLD